MGACTEHVAARVQEDHPQSCFDCYPRILPEAQQIDNPSEVCYYCPDITPTAASSLLTGLTNEPQGSSPMKKDIHPSTYRPVVFQDLNNNQTFLTRSTVATEETITLDGVEYPLVKVHISSASHPFFTGQEKLVDIEGRVDKFKARQDAAKKRAEALQKAASKQVDRKAAKIEKQEKKIDAETER